MGRTSSAVKRVYTEKTYDRVELKLHRTLDKDIIEYLADQSSKMGTIKTAIREMMAKEDNNV